MSVDLFGHVSTLDTGARSAFDFYETPKWMTRSLLTHHPDLRGSTVLEPAAGNGAIAVVLREDGGCRVHTNDLDQRQPAHTYFDATREDLWQRVDPLAWVVSNLPFDVAFPILQRAVAWAQVGVALLLRKTFLEPTEERGGFLATYPPTRVIGLPRHKFRGASSDSVSCDWMLWERVPNRRLPPIVIDDRAKARA